MPIVAATLFQTCIAATNAIELAVRSFPEISAPEYRPDLAILSANAIIAAGEETACATLDALSSRKHDAMETDKLSEHEAINRSICLLCRLLFMPKNAGEPLRPPKLGMSIGMPYASMDATNWPDLPFVITNGVPISISLGYALGGVAERSKTYLDYCRSKGNFRAVPFPHISPLAITNALNQVFNSPAWRSLRWKDAGPGWHYDLDEGEARQMLWKQAENLPKR